MVQNTDSHYHIIINPVSGQGKAPEFIESNVIPLLDSLSIPYTKYTTSSPRDAGRIGQLIRSNNQHSSTDISESVIRVIVAGGDGTAHEMIEGVTQNFIDESGERPTMKYGVGRWELSILPLGTANALFHSLFPKPIDNLTPEFPLPNVDTRHSLTSLLISLSSTFSSDSTTSQTPHSPRRLPISLARIFSSPPPAISSAPAIERTVSHIVISTSLHAALLSDSEALRDEYPGVERFKVAAAANLGVFFAARAVLLPNANSGFESRSGSSVLQFNPETKAFVPPFTAVPLENGSIDLAGPFTYFLSSGTCPRLEQKFVVAPTLAIVPPSQSQSFSHMTDPSSPSLPPPTMDIIVARPLRDPNVAALSAKPLTGGNDSSLAPPNEAWSKRVQEVFGAAYREGQHVFLTYPSTSSSPSVSTKEFGDGELVVEVFRCGGFEWIPATQKVSNEEDKYESLQVDFEKTKILCVDGSLHNIPEGGHANVQILVPDIQSKEGFWVWG